jgi:NAD(P)-dependent dehydrogenase (short-subunit alcohol dehydrogenase family)
MSVPIEDAFGVSLTQGCFFQREKMYDLKGKVVMVTGAARKKGLGRAIALRLAEEGGDVIVHGRDRSAELCPEWEKQEGWKGLDSLAEEIETLGRQALAVTADIAVKKEVEQMVTKAIDRFGHIDILVNNAAFRSVEYCAPLLELSEDLWNKYLAVNLTGTLLVSKAVVKHMKEHGQGGKIIHISSVAGQRMHKDNAHYCVSKMGIIGLSQVMALEWAPYKINVNVICPGSFATMSAQSRGKQIFEAIREGLDEEEAIARHYKRQLERIPLGRVGSPPEVASLVAFLASNQSDYITGEAIGINGGSLLAD